MSMNRASVTGLKELDAALEDMKKSVAKRHLVNALKKAAEPTRAAAESGAPRLTGRLAESIVVQTKLSKRQRKRRAKQGLAEVFIGASFPKGAHAHLIEFGTSKMPARPFLRPAWDGNKGAALETMKTELWGSIERAAKRAAKKAERKATA